MNNDYFIDHDILTVIDVAALLHCSEDKVRRIDPTLLPVYRVGRYNLYLREDVISYIRRHCRVRCGDLEQIVSEIEDDLLDSAPDGVRERSHLRRAS